MPQSFGYLVDLSGISFDEGTTSSWIQAMPNGEYQHPLYGTINMDDTRAKEFADNVTANVRGQELDIDYDHKAKMDKAAGWVKKAEVRPNNGLWLFVEWTKNAYEAIKNKEYKYFSPEFYDEWTHPSTKKTHKNVLFGGGLTNRPFLKGITPINLTEFVDDHQKEGSKDMAFSEDQLKALRTKYKLAEDADEAAVIQAAIDFEPEEVKPDDDKKLSEFETQLAEVKKLAEGNAAMAPMVALMEQQAATLKALEEQNKSHQASLRLSETGLLVDQLAKKFTDQGWAISPVDKQAMIDELSKVDGSVKLSESPTYKLMETFANAKLTQLGELGHLRVVRELAEDERGKSAQEIIMARANKLTEGDKGMTFSEAMKKVARDDEDLYTRYRNETGNGIAGGAS